MRQQSAARISSSFFRMSLCRPAVQSWATAWFRFWGERTPVSASGGAQAGGAAAWALPPGPRGAGCRREAPAARVARGGTA